ncbi:MAG: helix-turn-helix domain-containing protein [Verrucomicrobiia bacterium]
MRSKYPSSLPEIVFVRSEQWNSRPYAWNNARRGGSRDIVLQQTLSGSVAHWSGGRRREVAVGHAMLFRHGERSRYGLDEDCLLPYSLRWIMVSGVPAMVSIYEDLRRRFGPVLRMRAEGEASRLLAMLLDERGRSGHRNRIQEAEDVFRLFLAIYREQVTGAVIPDAIAHGRDLLENEYRQPRNIKEWAALLGLTREHFTRAFHRRYGETPAHFLRRLRLRHAKRLMATPGLTLRDVAQASGFASGETLRHALHRGGGPQDRQSNFYG